MTNNYSLLRWLASTLWLTTGILLAARAQAPTCPIPTSLNVATITATGASVSFLGPANATSYTVIYAPLGINPNAGITVVGTSSPIALTGLIANTTYSVYIQVTCGSTGQSTLVGPVNFTTRSATVISWPYSQNFDGPAAPAMPENYTTLDANNDGRGWANVASTYAKSPTNVMQYTGSPTQAADDWFFTTDMAMRAGRAYQLQFSYRVFSGSSPEALEVKAGPAATPAGQTTTLFTGTNLTNTTYTTTLAGSGTGGVLSFTPPTSGIYYFSFHATSAANQSYLFVDDIAVYEAIPTATIKSAVSEFSIDVTPVPFGTTLNLSLTTPKAGLLQLTLRDAVGRTVRQTTTAAVAGSNTVAVPEVASLPAGVYFLMAEQGGTSQTIRVAHN